MERSGRKGKRATKGTVNYLYFRFSQSLRTFGRWKLQNYFPLADRNQRIILSEYIFLIFFTCNYIFTSQSYFVLVVVSPRCFHHTGRKAIIMIIMWCLGVRL